MRYFVILFILVTATLATAASDFELRDGDKVVLMGDSITAALTYGKIMDDYTLLRFPDRKIQFFNAGKGGDTAQGCLQRLEKDVFSRGATVLTVAFGINDIGWGMRADEEHKKLYLEAIRQIIEKCKARGIRVYICSAPITGADPNKSETDFLQKMCDEGMALSRSLGEGAIDVQRTMRGISKKVWAANAQTTDPKAKVTLHAEDTIHLNDMGQMAMAYAILKGLGAPADISSASLSARSMRTLGNSGCKLSDLRTSGSEILFTRLDQGLPLNLGLVGILSYRFVPIPDELGRYMLTISDLPAGNYDVLVDGVKIMECSDKRLSEGVNLGMATMDAWVPGSTWGVQAVTLRNVTDAKNEIEQGQRSIGYYLPGSQQEKQYRQRAQDLIAGMERLRRETAHPVPYHFCIRPTVKDAKPH